MNHAIRVHPHSHTSVSTTAIHIWIVIVRESKIDHVVRRVLLSTLQHVIGVNVSATTSKEAFVDLNIDIHLLIYI